MVLGLFLYTKLINYEHLLAPNFKPRFTTIKNIFQPIFKLFGRAFKPYKVGNGLSLDIGQLVFLLLLLLILLL